MTIDLRLVEAEPTYLKLMRIKQFKEDVAAKELAKKQAKLDAIIQQITATSVELRSFRLWMKEQETQKFKQILSQKMPMFKLSELRQSIREMARKEQKMLVQLDDLQQQKIDANQELTTARTKYHLARRKVLKFEAVQDLIKTEKTKYLEQAEEKILEEYATRKEAPYDE